MNRILHCARILIALGTLAFLAGLAYGDTPASRAGVQGDILCAGNGGAPTLISAKTSARVFAILSNTSVVGIAVLETIGAAPSGPLTSTNAFIVAGSGGVLNVQSYMALYCQSTDATSRNLNVKEGLR